MIFLPMDVSATPVRVMRGVACVYEEVKRLGQLFKTSKYAAPWRTRYPHIRHFMWESQDGQPDLQDAWKKSIFPQICGGSQGKHHSPSSQDCVICLSELMPGDRACALPCEHVFHEECIGRWFAEQPSCPMRCSSIPRLRGAAGSTSI
jgi:hypothetical protein